MNKILAIDGGGIKGVYAATVLATFENTFSVRISECFDMIAGTSTGGIIAAALSLGIPAQTILDMYLEKGKDIFTPGIRSKFGGFIRHSKYKSDPLKEALLSVFGDKRISDCHTKLLIPAFNLETGKTRVFKTPHADDLYIDKEYKIVDCLMATTAAPTFFVPYKMKHMAFIDGGIGANNPSLIALVEGLTRCNWDIGDISLLNIGCLNEQKQYGSQRKMLIADAVAIKDCFMSAESQYVYNSCKLLLNDRYLRIDYESSNRHFRMDDATPHILKTMQAMGEESAMRRMKYFENKYIKTQEDSVSDTFSH